MRERRRHRAGARFHPGRALDSLPGLFYLIDQQGRFLRWNKNFEKVSGYSALEISAMSPLDFFGEVDRGPIAAAIGQTYATERDLLRGGFRPRTAHPRLFY